jgi:hypothetical protein
MLRSEQLRYSVVTAMQDEEAHGLHMKLRMRQFKLLSEKITIEVM